MKKNFHISDILTITDGRLVSFNGMDGVYDILNFMTGDDLFTHQLPRAMDICQPVLQKQLPHVNFNDWKEDINENNYKDAVNFVGNKHGFYFDVESCAEWNHIDPIQEAIDIKGKDNVVVINS